MRSAQSLSMAPAMAMTTSAYRASAVDFMIAVVKGDGISGCEPFLDQYPHDVGPFLGYGIPCFGVQRSLLQRFKFPVQNPAGIGRMSGKVREFGDFGSPLAQIGDDFLVKFPDSREIQAETG